MDKHFTITIHDENGVKKFNVHKLLKKLFFYLLAFFITIGLFGIGTILYLNKSVDKINAKRANIEKAYKNLQADDLLLQANIQKTKKSLKSKKEELDAVSNSLTEIEEMMGLKPIRNLDLQDRINITKLTSKERATLLELIPNGSPVKYLGITSKFGYRINPITHKREFHTGTDLRAKLHTPIYATANSIVEWAGFHKRSGYGNLIILVHSYGFKTYFGHLSKVVVKAGEFVKKGQLIGYTGNSGMSSGPHLHYEIRFLQRPLNAYWFIKWRQNNYSQIFEKEKKVPWQSVFEAMSKIELK